MDWQSILQDRLWPWCQWLYQLLFRCSHGQATLAQGKVYCPDCGAGLIVRWLELVCTGCQAKRHSRYNFRQIVPQERCCPHCGESQTQAQYLENPNYFQIHHALMVVQAEADYLQQRPSRIEQIKVWLEGASPQLAAH